MLMGTCCNPRSNRPTLHSHDRIHKYVRDSILHCNQSRRTTSLLQQLVHAAHLRAPAQNDRLSGLREAIPVANWKPPLRFARSVNCGDELSNPECNVRRRYTNAAHNCHQSSNSYHALQTRMSRATGPACVNTRQARFTAKPLNARISSPFSLTHHSSN